MAISEARVACGGGLASGADGGGGAKSNRYCRNLAGHAALGNGEPVVLLMTRKNGERRRSSVAGCLVES